MAKSISKTLDKEEQIYAHRVSLAVLSQPVGH
jgi:hypothetical protein